MSIRANTHKHKHSKKAELSQRGKNLRLSFDAWNELRKLKFESNSETYSDVLTLIFKKYKGIKHLNADIRTKPPSDPGDEKKRKFDRSDKTIVVSKQLHAELNNIKKLYMLEKGYSARGPYAVSISDVLLELIDIYLKSQ